MVHAQYGNKKEQQKSLKNQKKEMQDLDWNEVRRTKNIYQTLRTITPNIGGLEDNDEEEILWAAEIIKDPTSFDKHVKAIWQLVAAAKQAEALKLLEVLRSKISSGLI